MGFGPGDSREMEFPEVSKIIEAGKQSILQRILEVLSFDQWCPSRDYFSLQGTFDNI